jgi:preprotein translocase subunit SecA
MCAIALHNGKCAEMQTGEGKTLAAVFPAFLNALSGRGVHILTFNDYLAKRDAEWMGPVYNLLGLTVGCVQEGMDIASRKAAYRRDVTYLTAKEAGFDFLRDNCAGSPEAVVQRDLHYAIIDEADSILIDEARIPLVIAETTRTSDTTLSRYTECAQRMLPDQHFTFDAYKRKIHLTDTGIDMAEEAFECDNLYSAEQCNHLSHLFHALHAEYLLERDVDYLVRNDTVEIVDELTGRIAENRRWPDGLHGAVEAKEHCPVNPRGAIRSSITMYHFIALYSRRCGMTATAESSEEELYEWYQLPTVIIPPHKPCIRTDYPDRVFAASKDKIGALVDEIISVHATGQPVLVGTRTVAESQHLAELLIKKRVDCRLLNAKDDAYEAAIIAEAGRIGAVTISTNMAGRGTDIKLGGSDNREYDAVAALGGLYVIGTNRFESRRIDNQLRGRGGRQGDPGCSRFFISLEDDLFIRYRLHELIPKQYRAESANGSIDNHYVNNEINRLQRIIEGQNSDIKFTLGKYAHLLEQQRRQIHVFRKGVLDTSAVPECFKVQAAGKLSECISHVGSETAAYICRMLLLHSIDNLWSSHLAAMADIRDGIHLIRYGNQDPLQVFNTLAIELFSDIFDTMEVQAIDRFSSLDLRTIETVLRTLVEHYAPSATWTYMINDSPFKDEFIVSGNVGASIVAGLYWPITMLVMLLKRAKQKKRGKR